MVSRFVFAIVALSLISFGSGYLVKRESGVSKVMRCITKAFQNSYKEKVKGSGNADSMCNLYKWMDPCLINLEQVVHPGTVPLLDTMTFAFWQELTLVHKMGLCLDLSPDELKNYALKSGILTTTGSLRSIEEDDMNPCAQEALLNCTGFGKKNWPTYLASLFDAYFACLENTATTCDAPIWKHLLITYEALKEELNKNRGKFNQLSLNVTQNPEDVVQVYSAKMQCENLDTVLTSKNLG